MSPNPVVPLFELNRPLTTADLGVYAPVLAVLQGNILKGHGRQAAAHLLLTFKPDRLPQAKAFVRAFATRVTSAAEQQAQARRFRERRGHGHAGNGDGELFVGFFLTAKGYRRLLTDVEARRLPSPEPYGFSSAFWGGMEAMNSRFGEDALHDPDRSEWEPAFQRDIHAMVLLAHDDMEALNRAVTTMSRDVSAIAQVSTECGRRLSKGGGSIEHFGYRDAVSQPIFFEDDLPAARASFDPSAGPSLVLARDPLGASDRSCGSYLVFRKIEQNVQAFLSARSAYARACSFSGPGADSLAGAHIVGRFEDGTARALGNTPLGAADPDNNFNYDRDPAGLGGCPLDGHVRIMNPRPQSGTVGGQRRIVRRGVPVRRSCSRVGRGASVSARPALPVLSAGHRAAVRISARGAVFDHGQDDPPPREVERARSDRGL